MSELFLAEWPFSCVLVALIRPQPKANDKRYLRPALSLITLYFVAGEASRCEGHRVRLTPNGGQDGHIQNLQFKTRTTSLHQLRLDTRMRACASVYRRLASKTRKQPQNQETHAKQTPPARSQPHNPTCFHVAFKRRLIHVFALVAACDEPSG